MVERGASGFAWNLNSSVATLPKILFASAYGPAELERLKLGSSHSDFLQKPYSEADLIQKVRMVIDYKA